MITTQQKEQVEKILSRYYVSSRSVSKDEIEKLTSTLTPKSPKTGKPISFSTFACYFADDWHLRKDDYIYALRKFLEVENLEKKVLTEKQAQKEAEKVAELYGAELLQIKFEDGEWVGYFIEHGEKFTCKLCEG